LTTDVACRHASGVWIDVAARLAALSTRALSSHRIALSSLASLHARTVPSRHVTPCRTSMDRISHRPCHPHHRHPHATRHCRRSLVCPSCVSRTAVAISPSVSSSLSTRHRNFSPQQVVIRLRGMSRWICSRSQVMERASSHRVFVSTPLSMSRRWYRVRYYDTRVGWMCALHSKRGQSTRSVHLR
jgi:hypothetical protein